MALLTTLNRISYTADGAQTTFAYPFKVYASTDLTVYDNGVLQTSGYTVTGVGTDAGGNVVFTLAPLVTHTVLIVRIEPQTQATVLPTAGSFPAKSVETMSDKLTMLIQQLAEVDARALKLAIASAYKDLLVPDPVAGKFLQWKDTTALQNADVTASGSIGLPVVIAQGGTGSITQDAARLALGASGWKQGADIASAATLLLVNPLDGNLFNVTGSVGVTGIATTGVVAGTRIVLKFTGIPLLTTGVNFKLRGAVNYQVVANDIFEFLYLGGGVWQEIERNFSTAGTTAQFLRGDATWAALANSDLGTGTADTTKYLRGDRTWQIAPFTGSFVSAAQTITAGGALTIAHGLGVTPSLLQCRLVCQVGEGGYVANDELLFNPIGLNATTVARGVVIVPDATNINVRFGSDPSPIDILRKDTGAFFEILPANWKLVVRAWK